MQYPFDMIIDRKRTNSLKHDFLPEHGYPEDVLPLWVADMDFMAPPAVREAVHNAATHGIFGYTAPKKEYEEAAAAFYKNRHGYTPEAGSLVITPGVVFAIGVCLRAFTKEGDGVLIQPPVYKPFYTMVQQNNRRVVENPLTLVNGRYEIDFDDLAAKLKDPSVTLMLLCSPHNPVGRVWEKQALLQIASLCLKHDVLLMSDEIHCDFTYPAKPHHVLATLGEEIASNSILSVAPSKTFNIAGMQLSNTYIANPALRERFLSALHATGYGSPNICGLFAAKAAYLHGAQWLDELLVYLSGNLAFVRAYLANNIPAVTLIEPEGTFLLWLDFRALGLANDALMPFLLQRAKLWLDDGNKFGTGGALFARLNIGCPQAVLAKALGQLKAAVDEL